MPQPSLETLSYNQLAVLQAAIALAPEACSNTLRPYLKQHYRLELTLVRIYAILAKFEELGLLVSELQEKKHGNLTHRSRLYFLHPDLKETDMPTIVNAVKPAMRAKFRISRIEQYRPGQPHPNPGELALTNGGDPVLWPDNLEAQDCLILNPVHKPQYDEDGSDEDNTYAKFTPSGELRMTINNPALVGVYEEGDTFYLDFTPTVK